MLETSSGGSDTDTLRLQAGTIVDFLDWALPETARPAPFNGAFYVDRVPCCFTRRGDIYAPLWDCRGKERVLR